MDVKLMQEPAAHIAFHHRGSTVRLLTLHALHVRSDMPCGHVVMYRGLRLNGGHLVCGVRIQVEGADAAE